MMSKRYRRVHETQKRALADRLRAIMAADGLNESGVAKTIRGVDQPGVSRFLSAAYEFETPKIAAIINYVNMRKVTHDPKQLELPFETRMAMKRFLKANGDLVLLNSLIDVLTASAAR